jgi:TRAP-type C4-dicarboxylate transport system permease small subunit
MAARQCPNCLTVLPAGEIVSRSNDLVCPGCGKSLEISAVSRNLAAFAGLAAGWLVWKLSSAHFAGGGSALGWVLPIVYGILVFGIVSPIVLILLADLRLKPLQEVRASAEVHAPRASH